MSAYADTLPLAFYFLAGGCGDVAASLVSHPLDLIKVRHQLKGELATFGERASVCRTLRSIIHREGIAGLYQGLSAAVLRQSQFSTLRHGGYATLCAAWLGSRDPSPAAAFSSDVLPPHPSTLCPLWQTVICGAVAGSLAAFLANPADVALIRMQADGHWPASTRRNYRNALHAIGRIVLSEGLPTLWRGCVPSVVRAALVTTTQLPTYHLAKRELLAYAPGCFRAGSDDPVLHMSASIVSAAVASVATCPVDTVKTRLINMQTGGPVYQNVRDCVRRTLATEGARGFFKGLTPTFARLLPHTIIMWQVNEFVLRQLWRRHIDVRHGSMMKNL